MHGTVARPGDEPSAVVVEAHRGDFNWDLHAAFHGAVCVHELHLLDAGVSVPYTDHRILTRCYGRIEHAAI